MDNMERIERDLNDIKQSLMNTGYNRDIELAKENFEFQLELKESKKEIKKLNGQISRLVWEKSDLNHSLFLCREKVKEQSEPVLKLSGLDIILMIFSFAIGGLGLWKLAEIISLFVG